MCKLCNSSNPPRVKLCFDKARRTTKSEDFINAVFDFTGENPCDSCIKTYYSNKDKKSVDLIIMGILMTKYIMPNSKTKKGKSKIEAFGDKTRKLINRYKYEVVEKCICKIVYPLKTTYRVNIVRNGKNVCKSFSSLSEAISFRDSIVKDDKKYIIDNHYEKVDKNIFKYINNNTKFFKYIVFIYSHKENGKNKYFQKRFDTLNQARECRDEFKKANKEDKCKLN